MFFTNICILLRNLQALPEPQAALTWASGGPIWLPPEWYSVLKEFMHGM